MKQLHYMEKVIDWNNIFFWKNSCLLDGITPRTPALTKRIQNENNDNSSGQLTNRLSTKRTITNENPEIADNM